MDFLKAQGQRIREQLGGLTPSQRMLAASLAVIMVMTLLWWSRYAGGSEMEDVLGQDFSADEIVRVQAQLASRGIAYKTAGNRVQVAADKKFEALAVLTYESLLPQNTASGFDEIVQRMDSPFNTDQKQQVMFNRAKEATLAQIMRGWPGVREAVVVINNDKRKPFGDPTVQPTASVNLKMKRPGERADNRLIGAAADTVSGAVSGMIRSKVNVVIDGASHRVPEKDGDGGIAGGDTWMELVKDHERHFSQKIQDRLRWIDNVMVSVTVDPDIQKKEWTTEKYDKNGIYVQPLTIDEKTEEGATNGRRGDEPGAVLNTGTANKGAVIGGNAPAPAGGGGGGGEGSTTSMTDTKTKNQILANRVQEWIKSSGGSSAVVGTSVSVPRSHFVKIFKAAYPNSKDPDEATLLVFMNAEMLKIKNAVMGCVMKTPEDKVLVDWYYDYLPTPADAVASPAIATSIPLAITGHAKEIALGGLAVVSLFMMTMMVRRSTPAPIIAPKPERPAAAQIAMASGIEAVAGEAGEGVQSMDAMEVDDDSIRTQQMIGQVSNMVKEDPDAAANLVKRWLNRA
jgi:flagellar M-ring protein FliF